MLEVTVFKMAEKDDFQEGCNGKCHDFGVVEKFKAKDFEDALCLISGYRLPPSIPTIFNDRLEICVTENVDGEIPTERELASWKVGNATMYCVNYSFYISEIKPIGYKMLCEKFPQLDADCYSSDYES